MKGYQLGLYEKAMPSLTWREKMLRAKEAGFDYLEISIDETDAKLSRLDWSREKRRELASLMEETGLPLRSMCLSGHRKYPLGSRDLQTRQQGMQIMKKAIRLAADLGLRTIQLAGYDVYYEESGEDTKQYFAENLRQAVEMAAAAGVGLGFETMETEFMNTVGKAMAYVQLINSPYLNVYPDIGNLTNAAMLYGTDVLEDLATGDGHVMAMHLKETVPGVFREVPFGTGYVDFESAIHKAWTMGVRRYVTELWYTGNENWEEEIFCAREMMGGILDRQGSGT